MGAAPALKMAASMQGGAIHDQHYGGQTGYTFHRGDGRIDTDTAEAMAIFKQIDEDSSGSLSWEELWRRLHDHGMEDARIEEFYLAVDKDRNGIIDCAEFCDAYARYKSYFVHAPPPQTQSTQLELWYKCPNTACSQTIVNNTGSNTFGCPYCNTVIQGVPSEKPVMVQQTTICINPACGQILLVPTDPSGAASYMFACSTCGQAMTSGQAPSVGTDQTVEQLGGANKNNYDMSHGPTESAMQNMLWEAFMKHDQNNDGNIDKNELHQLLSDLNFPAGNINTDHLIDFPEFASYYNDLMVEVHQGTAAATAAVSAEQLETARHDLESQRTELEEKKLKAAVDESKHMHELDQLRRELADAKQLEEANKAIKASEDEQAAKANQISKLEEQQQAAAIKESQQMAEMAALRAELEERKALDAVLAAQAQEAQEAVLEADVAAVAASEADVAAVAAAVATEKENEMEKKFAEMQAELDDVRRDRLAYRAQAEMAQSEATSTALLLEEHLHSKEVELATIQSTQEALDREYMNNEKATKAVVAQAQAAQADLQDQFTRDQEANAKRVADMRERRRNAGSPSH